MLKDGDVSDEVTSPRNLSHHHPSYQRHPSSYRHHLQQRPHSPRSLDRSLTRDASIRDGGSGEGKDVQFGSENDGFLNDGSVNPRSVSDRPGVSSHSLNALEEEERRVPMEVVVQPSEMATAVQASDKDRRRGGGRGRWVEGGIRGGYVDSSLSIRERLAQQRQKQREEEEEEE
eukprot:CAMPEP_0175083714 /NCGR_PEP_ID=MMETSP0052_2-20121109/27566_1 /TAXON_ID=51329 ORGANISM="Polytomella parva, Strain SAG 63-3" /NCGR_SAMPLE_ID=MMETSP0052_2 /ASSEMBLY_ACC=CAM_ASM_000194 /LENGTH=173 /DNA_ID=CAMNT_0016355255 /DNA_START=91 /DNA_END=609 /DNA_ORIENTATION=+